MKIPQGILGFIPENLIQTLQQFFLYRGNTVATYLLLYCFKKKYLFSSHVCGSVACLTHSSISLSSLCAHLRCGDNRLRDGHHHCKLGFCPWWQQLHCSCHEHQRKQQHMYQHRYHMLFLRPGLWTKLHPNSHS